MTHWRLRTNVLALHMPQLGSSRRGTRCIGTVLLQPTLPLSYDSSACVQCQRSSAAWHSACQSPTPRAAARALGRNPLRLTSMKASTASAAAALSATSTLAAILRDLPAVARAVVLAAQRLQGWPGRRRRLLLELVESMQRLPPRSRQRVWCLRGWCSEHSDAAGACQWKAHLRVRESMVWATPKVGTFPGEPTHAE